MTIQSIMLLIVSDKYLLIFNSYFLIFTNVWISFLIGQKSASFVRVLFADKNIRIVMTDILQQEIMTVASRPKFTRYFSPDACNLLTDFLEKRCVHYPLGVIVSRCRDPKDDYLLELAHVSRATFLVTGDNDLTEMREFEGCRIMTLAELREIQP